MGDGSVLSFGPDSELTLDDYRFAPASDELRLRATLNRGTLNLIAGDGSARSPGHRRRDPGGPGRSAWRAGAAEGETVKARLMSGTLLLAMAALGGCAQHSYVMLADDSGGRGAAVLGDEQRVLDMPGRGMAIAPGGQAFAVSDMQRKADFAKALSAQPALPERFTFHLAPSGGLDAGAEQLLDSVLLAARRRDYPVVTVIGHTDTLGHRAANEQVGMRRAQRMAELLRGGWRRWSCG